MLTSEPNPPRASLALATRGLVKRYGSIEALAGLDLSVPAGVVYGFLGPNGAGKTTTMRILTGLIRPDAGQVVLLDQRLEHADRRRLFRVGALVETPAFYPYLSGRKNLRVQSMSGAQVRPGRIDELLHGFGLAERADDKVSGYSLGMKQRLAIASALLSDPELLLLDEPANGLDPAGIVAVRDILRSLAAAGKTVFVSSHLLAEVQQLADVVGIIARGRLIREGPIGTMLSASGTVRVRIAPAEQSTAMAAIETLAGPGNTSVAHEPDGLWLTVRIEARRSVEVNRVLASAGVYAAIVEAGNDLESLFLELTAPSPDGPDGHGRGALA